MPFPYPGCYTRAPYAPLDLDGADANDGDASALSMICVNTNMRQGREIGPV